VLHESEDLYSLLEAHEGRALALYVYNSESDSCRQLTLIPNSSWGGQGRYARINPNKNSGPNLNFKYSCFSLGCGIAFGYLHRIPIRRRYPPAVPESEPLLSEQAKENLDPTLAVAQPASNVIICKNAPRTILITFSGIRWRKLKLLRVRCPLTLSRQ
jgi:hypothetical protein